MAGRSHFTRTKNVIRPSHTWYYSSFFPYMYVVADLVFLSQISGVKTVSSLWAEMGQ